MDRRSHGNSHRKNLADGRFFQARLIGADPEHDLAVLHIGAMTRRPYSLPLGTSNDLKVGQKSSPLATRSAWIGPSPPASFPRWTGNCPGNSGGPLLDSAGRLIRHQHCHLFPVQSIRRDWICGSCRYGQSRGATANLERAVFPTNDRCRR
jgi:hypothetical protein